MRRALLFVALIGCALVARAELTIEITQGAGKSVPVAVVPFGWQGQGTPPLDVAAVIAADLERSGRFQPLERRDMLQKPTRGTDIDFDDWRMVGAELIVVGRLLREAENDYTLEFQLFDIFRGEQLVGYRMPASERGLRLAAHRAADMIYEEITGIPGIFATRIAYITAEGDFDARTYRLIVSDADGENQHTIVESVQPLMSPSWSPDGRRIAYVSFEGDRSAIWVQSLRSGNRQRVSQAEGINGAPVWSPDGRRLAMTLSGPDGNPDVWVSTMATGEKVRLTQNPAIDTEASWSPDGRSVYFTSDRSGGPQIYRVAITGGAQPARVTFEGRYNARPRISPDGSKLAVVHDDRGNYRIGVYDLDNTLFQVLSDGRLDESPDFAPNGATLIYATREDGRGVLATVSVDGTVKQRLASSGGDVREPVWSPFRRD